MLSDFPEGMEVVRSSIKVGGVPIGDDDACKRKCEDAANKFGGHIQTIKDTTIPVQSKMVLLQYCGKPQVKLNHYVRVRPPEITSSACRQSS